MECPSCGLAVGDDARFCPRCGFAQAPSGDERRVVSVVFADLVGFTRLSESMDPERVKSLVERGFERLSHEVSAFGGVVDKIVGDELVAVFGAPVAHEDDAERAVRAALRFHDTLAAYGAEVDVDLRLRVGVNTGEVLVGTMAGGDTFTVMGDVVNVAQRLETAAQPGQTLVGAATYGATREAIDYEGLGKVRVRGRDERIEAWAATGTLAPPGERSRTVQAPFVGRDRELAILRNLAALAFEQKRAQVIVLVGEAGVGKRRLAEELAAGVAAEHGAHALLGRCLPYGESGPFWPLVEMIHQACGLPIGTDPDTVADVVRIALQSDFAREHAGDVERVTQGILHVLGVETGLDQLEPAKAREETFRAIVDFLDVVVRLHPLLLTFTQVQWADESLSRLFAQVFVRLRRQPITMVATARPELLEHWQPAAVPNITLLEVDALSPEGASALVAALVGQEPPAHLRDVLLERSGGNPLFLEELCALLGAAGALGGDDGWDLSRIPGVADLPASLRGLVAARLDSLGASERSVIEDAAVVGRTGPTEALAELAACRGASTTGLQRITASDLLVVDGGTYEFKSEIVREVAYDRLTKADRAKRHSALAAWFSRRDGEGETERHEEIATHYAAAARIVAELGPVDQVPDDVATLATEALERAALRTQQLDLQPAAARLFDRALDLAVPQSSRRLRLLLGRARARVAMRDLDGARNDVDAVLAEADADDPVSRAQALTVLGDIAAKEGDLDRSLRRLEEALESWEAAPAEAATNGAIDTFRTLGMTHLFAGRLDEADEAIGHARRQAESAGDRRAEAWCLQNLAWIAFMRGDTSDAEQRLERSASLFADLGDRAGLGWARGLLGWVRFYEGRLDDAEELAESVLPEAQAVGDQWAAGMVKVLLASVRLWKGNASRTVALAEEAREEFQRLDDPWGELQSLLPLGRALVSIGEVDAGLSVVDDARKLAKRVTDPSAHVLISMFAGQIAATIGDPGALLKEMAGVADRLGETEFIGDAERLGLRGLGRLLNGDTEQALDDLRAAAEQADTLSRWAFVGGALALAVVRGGDPEEGARIAEGADQAAITYLDRLFANIALAFARAHLGRDDAVATIDAAVEVADGTDDVIAQSLIRLARARVLEAVGDERGRSVLDVARRRFSDLGVDPRGWESLLRAMARQPAPGASSL